MRRFHRYILMMSLAAIASFAPALARAQEVVRDSTSTATFTGASSAHRGFGVGAAALFWPGGLDDVSRVVPNLLVTWGDSAGRFHIDGLFGFAHQNTSNFDLGVRGWYHLHATPSSDLSAGGGFTLISHKNPGPGQDRQWDFELEIGAQMRAFIVSNVALLGSLGLYMYLPDSGDSTIVITGNFVGYLGLAYYFQ